MYSLRHVEEFCCTLQVMIQMYIDGYTGLLNIIKVIPLNEWVQSNIFAIEDLLSFLRQNCVMLLGSY